MARRKRRRHKPGEEPDRPKDAPEAPDEDSVDVQAGGWVEKERKLKRMTFPGPRHVDEPVRVAFGRDAYAELVAHAKDDLDAEICGVLVGRFCEDDEGPFVLVEDIIRGTATRQGGVHVTYTQETWTEIHRVMEEEHPKSEIVGWYHSHPGFGVTFSENDLFIQKNFFAASGQIGFVIDPLGGEENICANTADGVDYVSRFWVEGRKRECDTSGKGAEGKKRKGKAAAADEEVREALESLETRLSQVLQAVEEQRTSVYRILLTVGMFIALAVVAWIGYTIYDSYTSRSTPPKMIGWSSVPMNIGGQYYLLGLKLVGWKLPQEVQAELMEELKKLQAEARRKQATQPAPASGPGAGPSPGGGPAPGGEGGAGATTQPAGPK